MFYYLTYNEPFSGVYNSQVLDVVKHLREFHKVNIRLIAFLPVGFDISNYSDLKRKIKLIEPTAIIIPTVPIQYGWKFNWILLSIVLLFKKRGAIISREIFATYIGLKCKYIGLVQKICHDGRGASLAQMHEYEIYPEKLKKDIIAIEPYSINSADYRLAVSNALVRYWEEKFNYKSDKHVVIPCTLSTSYFGLSIDEMQIGNIRKKYQFKSTDIVLVFSGSSFGWQSFQLINRFCENHLRDNEKVKIMFLAKLDNHIKQLKDRFPQNVFCDWLPIDGVIPFLMACDYGLLLRESNDTNNVASPTKFAEYLAAGLPVIISDNLEFSKIVKEEDCGILVNNNHLEYIKLIAVDMQRKLKMREIAGKYFLKNSPLNCNSYNKILNYISKYN